MQLDCRALCSVKQWRLTWPLAMVFVGEAAPDEDVAQPSWMSAEDSQVGTGWGEPCEGAHHWS